MANAVAKAKETAVSEFVNDMFEDGSEGAVFTAEELQLPFLKLAQSLSPELDKNDAKYIEGLGAGEMFNSLTSEVYKETDVIPCYTKTAYKEWVPLAKGGGFVGELDPTDKVIQTASRVQEGGRTMDLLPNGNELVISDDYYCLIVKEEDYEPIVLSMTSTQRKVAKRWRTMIAMNKARNPKTGTLQIIPIYSTIWKLSSVQEVNKNNQKYANYSVAKVGPIPGEKRGLFEEAKSFRQSVMAGEVKVVEEQAKPAGSSQTDDQAQDQDDEIPF